MLRQDKKLQILFAVNFHISQAIKPAAHCRSRISKVDIIWSCIENLQLHISPILAINNSTAQLHTRLNPHSFQWAFITGLCTLSLNNNRSSINLQQMQQHKEKLPPCLRTGPLPTPGSAVSSSAHSADANILLRPGKSSLQTWIMSLALILISSNLQESLRCVCPFPTPWSCLVPISMVQGEPSICVPHFCQCLRGKAAAFMSFIMFVRNDSDSKPSVPRNWEDAGSIHCAAAGRGWCWSVCRIINTTVPQERKYQGWPKLQVLRFQA